MSDQANSDGLTGSPGTGDGGAGERQQGRGQARRAVLLGAAAASAGAVAGMALPAGAAEASSEAVQPATEPAPLQIAVAVQSTITLSQVNALVARVGGLIGCTPCGLLGVDLRLFGVDPAEVQDIQSLETVTGVASVVVLQQ
jgi:hypothetical protein